MEPVVLTKENFKEFVSANKALVDFWAPWCGPCRMVSPIVDEIANEMDGSLAVGKVNVDEQPQLASEFGVMSIPTLIVFKNGTEAARSVGARPKEELVGIIEQA